LLSVILNTKQFTFSILMFEPQFMFYLYLSFLLLAILI
jgi:hypothetical protein